MSRSFLLSLIFIAGALLLWLGYEELQRSRALAAQTNEIVRLPETASRSNTTPVTSDSSTRTNTATSSDTLLSSNPSPTSDASRLNGTTLDDSSNDLSTSSIETKTTASMDEPSISPASDTGIQEPALPTLAVNETPAAPETTNPPSSCSSFDETGLLTAFDNALIGFISDASALYGNRYENLQYALSSKQGTIAGEQGIVTTNYSGTVKELSTGQDVSANGTITAIFNWDGCTWQVVDYSF
jgi:hypothetical protein